MGSVPFWPVSERRKALVPGKFRPQQGESKGEQAQPNRQLEAQSYRQISCTAG
jgi:hypothetical protein